MVTSARFVQIRWPPLFPSEAGQKPVTYYDGAIQNRNARMRYGTED